MNWLDPRQWLLIAAFIGASVLGVKFWEHRLVSQGDEQGYARAQGEYKTKLDASVALGAKQTKALQVSADKARKEKSHAIQVVTADYDRIVAGLRQRTERPSATDLSTVADDGQAPLGCTGAQLYRPDGEFLARESLRAETIRIELKACYDQYDRAAVILEDVPEK